jgi:outer membrane protein assembly factor BamB
MLTMHGLADVILCGVALTSVIACKSDVSTKATDTAAVPRVVWHISPPNGVGGIVYTLAAPSPTRVFAVSPAGTILALDRATGDVLWSAEPGDRLSVSKRLLLNGDRLLWSGKSVAGYDAASGQRIWTYRPAYDTERCDPAVVGEFFIVCTDDWTVVALRAATGEVVWTRPLRDSLAGVPLMVGVAASNDTVYAAVRQDYSLTNGFSAALIFALDRSTGKILSKTQEGNYTDFTGDISTPTVNTSRIVLSHLLKNKLTAIDRFTSRVIWRFEGEAGWTGFSGPLSVVDGVIYAASGDRRVYALDVASGQLRWKSAILEGSQDYAVACGPFVLTWTGVNVRVLRRSTGDFIELLQSGPGATYDFSTRPVVDGTDVFLQSAAEIRKVSCLPQ